MRQPRRVEGRQGKKKEKGWENARARRACSPSAAPVALTSVDQSSLPPTLPLYLTAAQQTPSYPDRASLPLSRARTRYLVWLAARLSAASSQHPPAPLENRFVQPPFLAWPSSPNSQREQQQQPAGQ